MAALGLRLVGAMLAFFGGKVFSFGVTDHAEPGLRHVTPHMFLQRIFVLSAIRRHSAALARYSLALLMTWALSAAGKERQRQHRVEHLVSDDHHQSRIVM